MVGDKGHLKKGWQPKVEQGRFNAFFRVTGVDSQEMEETEDAILGALRRESCLSNSVDVEVFGRLYGVDLIIIADDRAGLDLAVEVIKRRFGCRVYAEATEFPQESRVKNSEMSMCGLQLPALEEVLGRILSDRNLSLATAESCTGGYLGHLITEVPGSSDYFKMGVVAYSNEVKKEFLGVSQDILDIQGAVSEPVVKEMAASVMKIAGTDFGIAISGVAGPGGGTDEKPVGTVWLALCDGADLFTQRRRFAGDRGEVKRRAAYWALAMLFHRLKGD